MVDKLKQKLLKLLPGLRLSAVTCLSSYAGAVTDKSLRNI